MSVCVEHITPLHVCSDAIRTCWRSEGLSDTKRVAYCNKCRKEVIVDDSDVNEYRCSECGATVDKEVRVIIGDKDKALIDRVGNKNKHACFSDDTEVMTLQGWKYIKDVTKNDDIITLNPETSNIEYQKPTNLFEYDFKGELIHFKGKHIDLLVTDNHKVYISDGRKLKNRQYDEREFNLVEASEVFDTQHYHTKRSNGVQIRNNIPNNLCKLIGFFIGDGTYRGGKTIEFHITKERKITYLKNLGFIYRIGANDRHIIELHEDDVHWFRDIYLNNKGMTDSQISKLNSDNIKNIFDGWVNANGDYNLYKIGSIEIATTSAQAIDTISRLVVLCGWDFSISHIRRAKEDTIWRNGKITKKENVKDCYKIRIIRYELDVRFNNSQNENKPEYKYYDGKIHCLEVPNHIIMVRRHGKQIWSGNSTLEHIYINYKIEGISRALLQELSRHRIASLSVESTRYTLKRLKAEESFISITGARKAQKYLVMTGNSFVDNSAIKALENVRMGLREGYSNDVMKYALPEAYKVTLRWSVNMRSLQNFLDLRLNKAALMEIRILAKALYEALPNEYKYLVEDIYDKHNSDEIPN